MTLLRGDLAPAPRTLVDILTETAQECPDAAAIDNGRVVLTYSELHDQVTEVADIIGTALAAGKGADVSALRARVSQLALDFPLYEGLEQWGLMSRI